MLFIFSLLFLSFGYWSAHLFFPDPKIRQLRLKIVELKRKNQRYTFVLGNSDSE